MIIYGGNLSYFDWPGDGDFLVWLLLDGGGGTTVIAKNQGWDWTGAASNIS